MQHYVSLVIVKDTIYVNNQLSNNVFVLNAITILMFVIEKILRL